MRCIIAAGRRWLLAAFLCAVFSLGTAVASAARSANLDKGILFWPMMEGAVGYTVTITGGKTATPSSRTYKNVYCPALEVELGWLGEDRVSATWSVIGIDVDHKRVGATEPEPLSMAVMHPDAPMIFDEYADMDYVPLYPVYAWAPIINASSYEVELYKVGADGMEKRVRHFYTYEHSEYDAAPLNEAGTYYYRVRALDGNGRMYSEWNRSRDWVVTPSSPIAALGDSITHGGGVISVPPSLKLYCWESYTGDVKVKNLGKSGDETGDMLERFDRDVLPFAPKVLIIFGGVNDIRAGKTSGDVIYNLRAIMNKCEAHGITPVLVTVPPVNPSRMDAAGIEEPAYGWRSEREAVNAWIRRQTHFVDVATFLTDEDGNMRREFTSDGLHPDYDAKKFIGEQIGKYIGEHFENLNDAGDSKK
ncbi:MAG: GDSL-type esterase/lipase family protein [Selenomonadaceae bacterium]